MRQTFFTRLAIVLAAAVLCVRGGLAAETASKIAFEKDMNSAYERAVKENNLLVVYFYRAGCPWCSKTDQEIFGSERMIPFGGRGVFVKIDLARLTAEEKKVADVLQVTSSPTIVSLQPSEGKINVLDTCRGYLEADKFFPRLEKVFDSSQGKQPQLEPAQEPAVGRFTTKDAKVCPPNDEICRIAKELAIINSIPINKLPLKAVKPTEGTPAADKPRMAHEMLHKLLTANWKDVKEDSEGDSKSFSISESQKSHRGSGVNFFRISFTVTPDGQTVWVWATMSGSIDVDKIPKTMLWQLLTLSNDVGRPAFQIDRQDRLEISMSLDADIATTERLQNTVDQIKAAVGESHGAIAMIMANPAWSKVTPKKERR